MKKYERTEIEKYERTEIKNFLIFYETNMAFSFVVFGEIFYQKTSKVLSKIVQNMAFIKMCKIF